MKKTKKILCILLCFLVLCSSLFISGTFASALSNRHGYINGSDVNIRSGAGTSNSSLGKLALNTPVLVTGVAFASNGVRWYKLTAYTTSGNIDGYVSANYVTVTGSDKNYSAYVANADAVNVRTAPGTSNASITKLVQGTPVTVIGSENEAKGNLWYHIRFTLNGAITTGYMRSDYIQLQADYTEDADFEAHLTNQGFPESYKAKLRQLHALYPQWVFIADKLDITWDAAVAGETLKGISTVHGNASPSWKSLQQGDYNWENGTWAVYDSGGWVAAADNVVKYYLDPRNFLTTTGVFQFISMKYDPALNTREGLQSALDGTFMAGAFPESDYETYADVLIEAAKRSGVSPIALAAMITIEQGSNGQGGSICGNYPGYEGYYNFYNIRAYASGNYNAIQYGLLYAKETDATYYRPWNTRAKSILGGAKFYANGYLDRGQNTLYYKKFNVVYKPYFSHQYMTNIQGAASEAAATASGYRDIMNSALVFNIPVYMNMPDEIAPYPTTNGNNDCYLSDISLNGYSYTPTFNRYVNNYELIVPENVSNIIVTPVKSNSESTVIGGGNIKLDYGMNNIRITVTSSSGLTNVYTVSVFREGTPKPAGDPVISSNVYRIEGTKILGIKPSTSKEVFITNLNVEVGTAEIKNSTNSLVRTGDAVEILDSSGAVKYTYTLVVECDINCDGKFSIIDIAAFQRHLLAINTITNEAVLKAADLNQDGRNSLVDIARMQRKYLGIDS